MTNSGSQEGDERTELEDKMVLTAPMPYELEAFGKMLVKAIQKTPPEVRPAALAAALAMINGFRVAADAAIEELPDYPLSLSTNAIESQAKVLEAIYKNLPPHVSAKVFQHGLDLIQNVDEMVDPLGNDPPTYPHQLTERFVNHQLNLLTVYVTENALK